MRRLISLTALLVATMPGTVSAADFEFLGPNGERLSVWAGDGMELSCDLQSEAGYFSGTAKARNGVYTGMLKVFREGSDESVAVGEFFLRMISEDRGDAVLIAAPREGEPVAPDPSGAYRLLDYDEQLKIARERHAEADGTLNAAYTRVMGQLPDKKQKDLRKRQRSWIKYRDYMSDHQAGFDEEAEGNANRSVQYWESMAGLTESRVEFLELYGRGNPDGKIEGVWKDEAGGLMELRLGDGRGEKGGLTFSINVVRGPTYHSGEIEGLAPFTGDGTEKAVFVDNDREAFIDGKPCRIEFLFDGEKIDVKGENTQYYHGARAYFDGTFFRSGPLEPE